MTDSGSRIFFTSDLHFGHKNIIRYCDRPFTDTHEMDEALIARWNSVVGPTDTVWVLGDVSFRKPAHTAELVSRLNGHKKLVRGNHDRGAEAMIAMGFECAPSYGTLVTEHGPIFMIHDPEQAARVLPTLASSVLVDLGESDVTVLPHSPAYTAILCGHVHDYWRTKLIDGTRFINVGCDVWDYTPRTLEELLEAPNMPEPAPEQPIVYLCFEFDPCLLRRAVRTDP